MNFKLITVAATALALLKYLPGICQGGTRRLMMRVPNTLGSFFGMAAACVALSTAMDARADDTLFLVTTPPKGGIQVVPVGSWRINQEAAWKATVGAKTFGKENWKLNEQYAFFTSARAGDVVNFKVYICNDGGCKTYPASAKVQ